MEARVEALFKSPDLYEVEGSMLGKDLKGKKYKPIFDYFAHVRTVSNVVNLVKELCFFFS